MVVSKRGYIGDEGDDEAEPRSGLAAWLAAEKKDHLLICDGLERLADQLPNRIDETLVAALLTVIEPSWHDHMRCHRELITPLLSTVRKRVPEIVTELALLDREHFQIAGINDEVLEQLTRLATRAPVNYETLGYILRCAFDGRRRHFEWEASLFGRVLISGNDPGDMAQAEAWCTSKQRPALPEALTARRTSRGEALN
ncbi:MAG: hypothetical protein WC807_05300 [Hyphomicrobium sp.]|jgi:hypothetical protein